MFPLAALVAVAQAATNGEGYGDLVRHLQHDALGQVGVVVVQNDSFHSCLHFDVGWLTGQQIEMEGAAGSGIQGSSSPQPLATMARSDRKRQRPHSVVLCGRMK